MVAVDEWHVDGVVEEIGCSAAVGMNVRVDWLALDRLSCLIVMIGENVAKICQHFQRCLAYGWHVLWQIFPCLP